MGMKPGDRQEFTGRHAAVALGRAVMLCALLAAGCTMQPLTRAPQTPAAVDTDAARQAVVERARQALRDGRAEDALSLLATLRDPTPVPIAIDAAAVRGQALFRVGRPAEAVTALVERELWLERSADIIANQRLIWDGLALTRMPEPPPRTGDPVVDGWLALAPLAATPGTTDIEMRQLLAAWRGRYVNHPAAAGVLAEYFVIERPPTGAFPRQIALLLPLSSAQRSAALAIRDGFLAAHLGNRDAAGTSIRLYDTAASGSQDAYWRAQQEGADFIVGPLFRSDVDETVAQAGLVPTLALNFTQRDLGFMPGFFQFALAPEDEARAIARHAIANGARHAAALVPITPGNDRADRILAEFRSELEARGGRLLVFDRYEPTASDFSAQVTALLNINHSNQRRTRLQANLGTQLQFEPRLRQDVDFILLVADARTGRLLAPQLRFHDAGDIPTYAISDIYEPGERASESDLNGILFADLPWVLAPDSESAALKRELESYWPQRSAGGLTRFYAMGHDAYRLVAPLYDWTGGFAPIAGMSGRLVVDESGRIRRALPVAQFRNGRPVAIDVPERYAPQALGFAAP
jgi:uncharacterized protein